MDWAAQELRGADLGDKRSNRRLHKVLRDLGKNPTDSIPVACGSWSETKAAYRLLAHKAATPEKILESHKSSTLERIRLCSTVLLLQDTTTLNFTTQSSRSDVGPINRTNTRGMFLHPTIAVTPERECLGVLSYHQWYRENLANQTQSERTKTNFKRDLKNKESYRWLAGYRIANELSKELTETMIVSISDREGDLYDIFQEAQDETSKHKAYWLIRSQHKRGTLNEHGKKSGKNIQELAKAEAPLGFIEFELPARKGQKSRKVKQALHAKKIELSLPDRKSHHDGYHSVEATVIVAREVDPPKKSEPVEWVLLTNLPVNTLDEAREKVQWYMCRWQIEIYFKVLKSGCRIEKLQLSDNNFAACLSLYMIIAWRILFLTTLGRECPDLPCDCVLSKEEWQTVFVVVKKAKPPKHPPKLNDVIRMIASLGGYMNRKSESEPGAKTLWIGLRNLQEHIKAKQAFEEVFGHTYG